MDDRKAYATLLQFCNDIKMSLGVDECRKLHMSRGEVNALKMLDDCNLIRVMTDEYILQARALLHSAIEKVLKTAVLGCIILVLASGMSANNITMALTTFAFYLLTYHPWLGA